MSRFVARLDLPGGTTSTTVESAVDGWLWFGALPTAEPTLRWVGIVACRAHCGQPGVAGPFSVTALDDMAVA